MMIPSCSPRSSTESASFSRDSRRLAPDFVPSEDDILCGRSKSSLNHVGNQHFRETVLANLDSYKAARTKLDKSIVVTSIVDFLRSKSPNGGFVRCENGVWYEIGNLLAREKVGHALRDAIKTRNKREEKRRSMRKTAVETRRDSMLTMQRQLFQESLSKMGQSVENILLRSIVIPEVQQKESNEFGDATFSENYNDQYPEAETLLPASFHDADHVEKQELEPTNDTRQITIEKIQPVLPPTSPIMKKTSKRMAMGDEEFYDIALAPTMNRCQVTLEDKALSNFLALEMMLEQTPVVGPGIVVSDACTKTQQEQDTQTPPTCNHRQVSVDQEASSFPSSDSLETPSIRFTFHDVEVDALDEYEVQQLAFHDVEVDALDEYVVQRISNWAS